MRYFFQLGLIAILLGVLMGCGDGKSDMQKNGVKPASKKEKEKIANKRTYWDNDPELLKESYFVLEDSAYCKHGPYKKYSKDGVINMEYMYELGNPSGTVRDYYSDGTLYSEYTYKNGQPDGKFTWYYPDGTVKLTGKYLKGEYTDTIKEFDETGKLISATTDYSAYK